MTLKYFPETDTLYVNLSSKESAESYETSKGVVIDLDEEGLITGLEIENASSGLDFDTFSVDIPFNELRKKQISVNKVLRFPSKIFIDLQLITNLFS